MIPSPTDAPAADQIEISIFGKGLGEAIVVHIGAGRWITIDSFEVDKRSIAQIYFDNIGVDPTTCVEAVVATHWHDDHVKGITSLFSVTPNAEIIVPMAMCDDEFVKFAAAFANQKAAKFSSGVEEFGGILKLAYSRHRPGTQFPMRFAKHGSVGFRCAGSALPHGATVTLEGLSPSDHDMNQFLAGLAKVRPTPASLQQASNPKRNEVSAAFWLQIGQDAVLLAADVENSGNVNSGWKAILAAQVQPLTKASLVKIPHHGGASGHHDAMWTQLLSSKPLATLAPWTRGGGRLPTGTDIDRILPLTGNSFATGPSAESRPAGQPPMVAKEFGRGRVSLRRVMEKIGLVRHRGTIVGDVVHWTTDLFGEACTLSAMTR